MGKKFREYQHVQRIERITPISITIFRTHYDTTYVFNSSKECLEKYIELQNEFKEAMYFGRSE